MSLLEVRELRVSYYTRKGELKAVDGVSFDLDHQETIGIVGESGCGKSTLGMAILRLVPSPGRIVSGSIRLEGREILSLREDEMRKIRGREIAMVFQDPMTSLNPVKRIGDHFVEAIRTHFPDIEDDEAIRRAERIALQLGIPAERLRDYPHQLSGGMKQRVMIGLGLVLEPKLLIADEPTTSLDVIIEAQILELLKKLKRELKLSMILITHNLGIVAEIADKIAIMYAGQIVELADKRSIFERPLFPYTQLLLKLAPNIESENTSLQWIPGSPPDLTLNFKGCRFTPRCPYAFERCRLEEPRMIEFEKGHFVACHLYDRG